LKALVSDWWRQIGGVKMASSNWKRQTGDA
jgi:hypothetical protein